MENDVAKFIVENWEVSFLYGLKYLKDISKSISEIKTILAIHETKIENLERTKKCLTI